MNVYSDSLKIFRSYILVYKIRDIILFYNLTEIII